MVWKLRITKGFDGKAILSRSPVIPHRITGTNRVCFYLQPGEPVGILGLCGEGTNAALGFELQPGYEQRVHFSIVPIGPPRLIAEAPDKKGT